MAEINIHNYEAYYLDYIEGNLSAEDTASFLLFLENNPSLKTDIDDFEDLTLADENDRESFQKSALYQQIDVSNAESHIVALIDNEISKDDRTELQSLIDSNKIVAKLLEDYRQTILVAEDLSYPDKHKLKKKNTVVYYLRPTTIAAAAAVGFVAFIMSPSQNNTTNRAIALSEVDTQHIAQIEKTINEDNLVKETTSSTKSIEDSPIAKIKEVREQQTSVTVTDKLNNTETKEPDFLPEEIVKVTTKETQDIEVTKDVIVDIVQEEEVIVHTDETLELGEWANRHFRKNVLNEDNPTTNTIHRTEVFAALANKIDQKTKNTEVDYNFDENNNRKSFSIKIGKFEYSRSKSK